MPSLGQDGAVRVWPTQPRRDDDADGLNTATWPTPTDDFVTPTDSFFTRSHAPTPVIDARSWRLEVTGLIARPVTLTLDDLLRRYPMREVTSTMVCAGLRRSEFLRVGPLPGELPWGPEPVSTGRWGGIALRDLLGDIGVAREARYVEFVGLDCVERLGARFGFGGSIDLEKAMSPEVLLATRLNGDPLPPDHGFPVRAVVPGWTGARSVKWLGRIVLSAEPSENYFQRKAYRVQRSVNPNDRRDVTSGVALTEVPLNAVILGPQADEVVTAGCVRVHGWAMGSGGRPVTAVEVSCDGGARWVPAAPVGGTAPWAWVVWEALVDLAPGTHTLVARAADSSGTMQPAALEQVWNVRGYNNNAWHRVAIRAV
jgi:sulfite oxidase